ncbi:hypothetical protein [Staphylococcus succinus]|uniref:hypothetical protein n=1 Tax=Staphylococcus succinus TaxID=61015 RepID=UPI000E6792E6|nr:hypothetical protein [Staphylococcus succinus]RIN23968.1 hypothetical protein BU067_10825 [Staphylococcus succinus]
MGYEIVRSLSFDFEKLEAYLSVASSNVTPTTFYKEVISGILNDYKELKSLSDIEKFLFPIIIEVRTGVFKLRSSVSIKVRYAFCKTLETIYEIEREHNIDLWNIKPINNNLTKLQVQIIKETVMIFLGFYNEKDKTISKKIIDEKGRFIKKINRHSIDMVYSKNNGKLYIKEKNLYLDMCKLKDYDIRFSIVKI